MRWLKFTAAGQTSWGLVEGDRVTTVNGDPFGEWQRTSQSHALTDVKIELPLIQASQGGRRQGRHGPEHP